MHIRITHLSEFDPLRDHGLHRLRLWPASGYAQEVRAWTLALSRATEEARFVDHLGNETRLIAMEAGPGAPCIRISGEIETLDKAGVAGPHRGYAPLWLFLRETPLTIADAEVEALAAGVGPGPDLNRLHALTATISAGSTTGNGPGEDAAKHDERAVSCTHLFVAAARRLGCPARCVSGYLLGEEETAVLHVWAEAHVDALGWVGFDPVHGMSPNERYVRLAIGRAFAEARPVSGIGDWAGRHRVDARVVGDQ
jgi:transglutaminase-like putative cysteine protease